MKITAEDLRISLRLRYTGFDTFDLGSTEARGGPLVLGTRDSLGADGTLEVRDGGGCGGFPLTGLGSHDWCAGESVGEGGIEGRKSLGSRKMKGNLLLSTLKAKCVFYYSSSQTKS